MRSSRRIHHLLALGTPVHDGEQLADVPRRNDVLRVALRVRVEEDAMTLRAKVSGHDVKLSWDPDPLCVYGWLVFRGDQPNPKTKRDHLPSPTATMTFDVTGRGVHHYRVRPMYQWAEGPLSNDVRVVVT